MMFWLLKLLSRWGIHSPSGLQKYIVRNIEQVSRYQFDLYPDDRHFGVFYIHCNQKKGFLSDLVVSFDYREMESFDSEPTIKIVQWPVACRNTWLVQNEKSKSDEDYGNLIEMLVYGILPMIQASCRNHLKEYYKDQINNNMV